MRGLVFVGVGGVGIDGNGDRINVSAVIVHPPRMPDHATGSIPMRADGT
jgi:hypothetical protein